MAMLQGDPIGHMLLHGVHEEDLERERQHLARVRLPLLHAPGLPDASTCTGVESRAAVSCTGVCGKGKRSRSGGAGAVRVPGESRSVVMLYYERLSSGSHHVLQP